MSENVLRPLWTEEDLRAAVEFADAQRAKE